MVEEDALSPVIGIIGGSGIYDIEGLEGGEWREVRTPWGLPSGELLFGRLSGVPCVFLPRHDRGHRLSPTDLPYRANIDALKRVEEELRAATLQAQAASEAKGRLLSGISHELRTPLNAILGFAQLMRMDCDDESQSEAAEYLDEILLASRHLNQLLGEILEWSSLQNEPAQLELQAVDVYDLMRECAELVSLEVQQRGLHLQLQLPDEPLQVLAEPRRLRQVLLNLLSNAMKYNVPNGHISLRTETSPGHVRLLVEDTGLGIEPAQQAQVFEPFQRLGRENSMIQGTGIGLSLCLEFARLMNGQLGLHSEPGVGSRFWIELPRLAPAALQ